MAWFWWAVLLMALTFCYCIPFAPQRSGGRRMNYAELDTPPLRVSPDKPACPVDCECTGRNARFNVVCSFEWIRAGGGGLPQETTSLTLKDIELGALNLTLVDFGAKLPKLESVELRNTSLTSIEPGWFAQFVNLKHLDLSFNRIANLVPNTFYGLEMSLLALNLSGNRLEKIVGLGQMENLKVLDISRNRIAAIERYAFPLKGLTSLNLAGNPLVCDCGFYWLRKMMDNNLLEDSSLTVCSAPPNLRFSQFASRDWLAELGCKRPDIVEYERWTFVKKGLSALLKCDTVGVPQPSVTWVTSNDVILTTGDSAGSDVYSNQTELQAKRMVLNDGALYITKMDNEDTGIYTCTATSPVGVVRVRMYLGLDYSIINETKIASMLFGLATAMTFLFLTLLVQMIYAVIYRFGCCCCCCRGYMSPKARQIKKMLDSVEIYKKQHLDRLRENYNMQMQKIRDNCNQQMEWLGKGYTVKADRFRDMCDYGSQKLDTMKDNYYDQVRRVREYSLSQMNKVRENYVFQRNRVKKFSGQHLVKIRENYKMQQLHLIQMLDNLPDLNSCRTVCARTDSVMFDQEMITMDSIYQHPDPDFPDCVPSVHRSNPHTPAKTGSLPFYTPPVEQKLKGFASLPGLMRQLADAKFLRGHHRDDSSGSESFDAEECLRHGDFGAEAAVHATNRSHSRSRSVSCDRNDDIAEVASGRASVSIPEVDSSASDTSAACTVVEHGGTRDSCVVLSPGNLLRDCADAIKTNESEVV